MVRFKVIKGSQLLLTAAAVVLALVIGALAINYALTEKAAPVSTRASLVENAEMEEAKTDLVFASVGMSSGALALDPEDGMNIEVIPLETPALTEDMPSVLIYHTHTHEAYEQVSGDQYVAIEAWRTCDQAHSIVRVGEELARLLLDRGFRVVHDTTDHEQDDLSTAYTRSLETLQAYEERFDLYIDLHRDAYIDGMEDAEILSGDQRLAQLMMLIGNGVGFDEKPYYEQNLAFAEALTGRINALMPGLCKDVLVKDGRYNQNIGVFSILVEVGHNRNTLNEALGALPYLADGLESLMIHDRDPGLVQMQEAYRSGER